MTLAKAKTGVAYKVKALHTGDHEVEAFLFTLGCYVGEKVVVVSTISGSQTIAVRDGRYSIDRNLANAIEIEEVAQ
ncbi:MAG: FeoA family protein [Bacillota bacterium]